MKTTNLLFAFFFMIAGLSAFAQKKGMPLLLKEGTRITANNISAAHIDSFNKQSLRVRNKTTAVLQFETLPTEAVREELKQNGIELLDYIPENAYTVSITGNLTPALLHKVGARTLTQLTPKQKMHPALAKKQIPGWAVKAPGSVDVQVSFPKTFTTAEVTAALKHKGILVISATLSTYHVLTLRVPENRIEELAASPFILYLQPDAPKDQPLNFNSRVAARSTALNTSVANGGKGLNGEGVVIGIGDDADVQFHADFSGRLINRASSGANNHGTHVHGIAAGGGVINEQHRGFAPNATIVSQNFNGILFNAPAYMQDYGMVVTNNSYGVTGGCAYTGTYDLYSYILDQQAFQMQNLQHVFAAGNSGRDYCYPFPTGYHTVLGAYQTAKNVLCVGNTDYFGNLWSSSSRGPVNDGRIKPEIMAMGTNVFSTYPTNSYAYNGGTSMAAPAVAGGLALMYQRYRQLNSNADPKSGLMKALLCNGATDKGNPGPDYSYGFGFMNLERSIAMLENNRYFINTVANGALQTHTITIPANTAQVKVMLYWHDPAPAFATSRNLVNDLDLTVTTSGATEYPKILNPNPAGVASAAVNGIDRINNIEQVVIDNPTAGSYTISVQGTAIAQNPSQEYYVVYDVIPVSTELVYPAAGTIVTPGEQTYIAWDSYGAPSNTFSLEYSEDNGANWTTITSGIDAAARTYVWTAPSTASDGMMVNIKRDGTSYSRTSRAFVVLGTPTLTFDAVQCEGYININWSPVAGATDYEVLLLRGSEMLPVATTTATSFSFNSLSKDSTYWVGVRARINGKPGRRSVSLSRKPSNGTCSGAISDNDLKLNRLVAPGSGRQGTSTELSTAAVAVEIKNLDDAPATGFTVKYRINNGAWVFENVTATIAAGGVYTHLFTGTEDFSTAGTYTITAVVQHAGDAATANDTAVYVIKQLRNAAINLATPFADGMEAAAIATYTTEATGLDNLERYDFLPGTNGRLRTFVNSGVAPSGNRAFALDADRSLNGPTYSAHYIIGTYNLSGYSAAKHDIRLEFKSINSSNTSGTENKVWVRGSDVQPWVEVFSPAQNGSALTSPSIEIGDALLAQGQDFDSSFQIRWGSQATGQVVSQTTLKGMLLDDITLYEVFSDMQLLRIDGPAALNCGLNNAAPVVVTLRNSSNAALYNVPVRYAINGGAWVSEFVASIPANTTQQYTFAATANLSAAGVYVVTAEVLYSGDTYNANNAAAIKVFNSETITTFPYLQNFENGSGGWYTDGIASSWQFGTPSSPKINRAASGTNAWKTTLSGNYQDNELSYLYSPCYTIAGMAKPAISFSVAFDIENCGSTLCDGAWLEYSIDNVNWYNLADLTNTGTNWYKAPLHLWNVQNYTTWHVATMPLPTGISNIRFRFAMFSDDGVTREGIAIDDIHIYDNSKGIYNGATMAAPVTQATSGNNWIHFESNGQLVASVLPNNQDLGVTDVQAFIHSGTVRSVNNQYYHNRNLVIKPANRSLVAPATVRFYFLDTEVNALLNASSCGGCTKPSSVNGLGVSKYSALDVSYENGTLVDNDAVGSWSFISPGNVTKVPFDKGYYAEFQVQDFSEFWLNNGSFNNNTPLPVHLTTFTAWRNNKTAILQWTAAEQNSSHYEIEMAQGNEELQRNRFQKIGQVASSGNGEQQYTFHDEQPLKTGVRFYRLKIVDGDGTFRYSEVRPVFFGDAVAWQVYPNPSAGRFHFLYQANAGDQLHVQIEDATGRTIKKYDLKANGFLQKLATDITVQAAGVYLLHVRCNGHLQSFKLYKQ